MSSIAPETAPTDHLNETYKRLLDEYDQRAIHYKKMRLRVWGVGLFCTFMPLVLAIMGLAGWLPVLFGLGANHVVLKWVIPGIHCLATALVGWQLTVSYRGWWLRFRAAAERLKKHCMLFRAAASPYDKPTDDAAKRFGAFLNRLENEMSEKDDPFEASRKEREALEPHPWWWPLVSWLPRRFRVAVGLEPAARARAADPCEEVWPRVGDVGHAFDVHVGMVMNRLDEQRRWHLRKAGQFYRKYMFWQVMLAGTYVASMVYVWRVGHAFEVVAIVAAIGLMLTAIRDFMEYGPLSLRYVQLADALAHVKKDHERPPATATPEQQKAWLAKLALAVEDRLASEFRAWYLVQEIIPGGDV